MTFKEKLMQEHPDKIHEATGHCIGCPTTYGYEEDRIYCAESTGFHCVDCWDREIPEDGVMTFAKKRMDEKGYTLEYLAGNYCPYEFGYEHINDSTCKFETGEKGPTVSECIACWNRSIPEETYSHEEVKEMCDVSTEDINKAIQQALETSRRILDSGERRQFETGAVRDIQEGKGRCDLMPLDIVGAILEDGILMDISRFQASDDTMFLSDAIKNFSCVYYEDLYTMFLDISKHFEEGAKKYGESNWKKGIPTKHYIDSAVRHYLKWIRGDEDEPHDRAFVWNLLCCIWTVLNKPELDDYRKD